MTVPTRRQLLAAAGAGATALAGATAALAGASGAAAAAGPGTAMPVPERLARLAQVELLLLFCYRHVLGSSILTPRAHRTLAPFVAHEEAHIAALGRQLRARGGRMPAPPPSVPAANRDLARRKVGGRLGQLKGDLDAVRLLLSTEQVVIGAYDVALAMLPSGEADLTELLCQIMANDAQHDAVLGLLLPPGKIADAVPYGLVQGLQ